MPLLSRLAWFLACTLISTYNSIPLTYIGIILPRTFLFDNSLFVYDSLKVILGHQLLENWFIKINGKWIKCFSDE